MIKIPGPAGKLYVDDGGAGGVPVLFVHSLAGNTRQWAAQLAHLRPGRRAVALDVRGHGRSDPPADGDYAIASLAADVWAVADALGLERIVLVGHSMGGAVAIAGAAARPERTAGLLLVDPNGDQRRLPAEMLAEFQAALESPAYGETIRAHWQRIATGGNPDVRATVVRDLEATLRATVVETFRALSAFDPLSALARYTGPRLSLITPLNETPIGLQRLVSDLPHRLVPGTGHWIHMDRPDVFNPLMDGFLAGVARA